MASSDITVTFTGTDGISQIVSNIINSLKSLEQEIGNVAKLLVSMPSTFGDDISAEAAQAVSSLEEIQGGASNVTKSLQNISGNFGDNIASQSSASVKSLQSVSASAGETRTAMSGLGNVGTAVGGIYGAVVGKGLYEATINSNALRETSKLLVGGLGDVTLSGEAMYKSLDQATNQSLVGLDATIIATNTFKGATGASAAQAEKFGQAATKMGSSIIAMGRSEMEANQAMLSLTRGIGGAFAALDQYGVTKDAMLNTGLWNGEESDVEGFTAALDAMFADSGKYMNTFKGQSAIFSKEFSVYMRNASGGVFDFAKNVLLSFNSLPGPLKEIGFGAIAAGGAISGMIGAALPAVQMYNNLSKALEGVTIKTIKESVATKANTVSKYAHAVANKVAAAAQSLYAFATSGTVIATIKARVATAANTAVMYAQAVATKVVAAAQWLWNAALSASPIGIVIMAVAALVAALIYLYYNFQPVTDAVNGLWAAMQDFYSTVLVPLGQYLYGVFVSAWNQLSEALGVVWNQYLVPLIAAWDLFYHTTLEPFGAWLVSVFLSAWTQLSEALNVLWNSYLVPLGEFLSGVFAAAWQVVSDAVNFFYTSVIQPFIDWISSTFMGAFDGAGAKVDWFGMIWTAASTIIHGVIDRIILWVQTMWTIVTNILGIIGDILKGDWASVWRRAGTIVQSTVDFIRGMIGDIPGIIWGIIGAVASAAASIGKAIFDGIVNALTGLANAIKDKIMGAVSGIGSFIGSIFGGQKMAVNHSFLPMSSSAIGITGLKSSNSLGAVSNITNSNDNRNQTVNYNVEVRSAEISESGIINLLNNRGVMDTINKNLELFK